MQQSVSRQVGKCSKSEKKGELHNVSTINLLTGRQKKTGVQLGIRRHNNTATEVRGEGTHIKIAQTRIAGEMSRVFRPGNWKDITTKEETTEREGRDIKKGGNVGFVSHSERGINFGLVSMNRKQGKNRTWK